jgi:hypothetical protein
MAAYMPKNLAWGDWKGLNDYDQFLILRRPVSTGGINRGRVNGLEELQQSVAFLRQKLKEYFG